MKSFNIILGFLLIACIGFSFLTTNNFDVVQANADRQVNNEISKKKINANDTISRKEFQRYMDTELIKPVRTIIEKHNPHVFMTKCYSAVNFELDERYKNTRYPLYKSGGIQGRLVFTECSQNKHMADVYVNLKEKTFTIQESYTSKAKNKEEYVSHLNSYMVGNKK